MAWALIFDGSNDYLTISDASIGPSTPFEIEWRGTVPANFARVFGRTTGNNHRLLIFNSSNEVRLTDSAGINATFTAPAYIKTDYNTFLFVRDALDNVSFFLNGVFVSTVIGFSGSITPNQIGRNGSGVNVTKGNTEFLRFSIGGVLTYNWDATTSSHAAGTPILSDIVSGNDATGVNMPTDGSAWVDLGGGSISVTEQTVNTNYTSLNPVVTLTGSISITESTTNTNYTSLNPAISFTGTISVVEQTTNTNYEVNNPTITLSSSNILVTESTVNTQYESNNPSILLTPEPLGIVSTVCFNGVLVDLEFNGKENNLAYNGQSISIEFNGDFNQLEFNGTIQLTCNTGSIKTNC